ncbi:MAG: SDR family NAD(P)-dependent oxidoreductase, partial [Planctomycetota bacterium]
MVVTGGAAGMGRTTCLMFAEEGAKMVVILDIQADAGAQTVAMIEGAGGAAKYIQADVSDAGAVQRAFDEIAETVGPYDVLFNHAGTIIV